MIVIESLHKSLWIGHLRRHLWQAHLESIVIHLLPCTGNLRLWYLAYFKLVKDGVKQNRELEVEEITGGLDTCLDDDYVTTWRFSIDVPFKDGALDFSFHVLSVTNIEARWELFFNLNSKEVEIYFQNKVRKILSSIILEAQMQMIVWFWRPSKSSFDLEASQSFLATRLISLQAGFEWNGSELVIGVKVLLRTLTTYI